jgi:hypothetical protein
LICSGVNSAMKRLSSAAWVSSPSTVTSIEDSTYRSRSAIARCSRSCRSTNCSSSSRIAAISGA